MSSDQINQCLFVFLVFGVVFVLVMFVKHVNDKDNEKKNQKSTKKIKVDKFKHPKEYSYNEMKKIVINMVHGIQNIEECWNRMNNDYNLERSKDYFESAVKWYIDRGAYEKREYIDFTSNMIDCLKYIPELSHITSIICNNTFKHPADMTYNEALDVICKDYIEVKEHIELMNDMPFEKSKSAQTYLDQSIKWFKRNGYDYNFLSNISHFKDSVNGRVNYSYSSSESSIPSIGEIGQAGLSVVGDLLGF